MALDRLSAMAIMGQHQVESEYMARLGLRDAQLFNQQAILAEQEFLRESVNEFDTEPLSEPSLTLLSQNLYGMAVSPQPSTEYASALEETLDVPISPFRSFCDYARDSVSGSVADRNIEMAIETSFDDDRLRDRLGSVQHRYDPLVKAEEYLSRSMKPSEYI